MPAWDLLRDILIMLTAALACGALAERLRQSAILGYLVAGTLVGPSVLGLVHDDERINVIAELGVALLLFSIGLEFSWPRLRALGRTALFGGLFQIGITLVAVAVLWWLRTRNIPAAISVGAMLALSSTACVVRVLSDKAALDSIYGRHALGILLVQDAAVIPLLLLVVALNQGGGAGETLVMLGKTVLGGAALVVALFLLLNYGVPRVLSSQTVARNRELPILLAIVVAGGAAFASHAANLSPSMGAFVAGVLLGGSPFATQIRADVAGLRTMLVTLFFAAIGMVADPAWTLTHFGAVCAAVLFILAGKTLVVLLILRSLGLGSGAALATGLCIAQVGEFAFVLAGAAHGEHTHLAPATYNLLSSAIIVTLFATPLLIAAAPRAALLLERMIHGEAKRAGGPGGGGAAARGSIDERARAHGLRTDDPPSTRDILIVGFGPAGQAVAEALYEKHADRLLVLELNPRNITVAEVYGVPCLIGDARHADVLEHCHVQSLRAIAITVPDPDAVRAIIEQCRALAPHVPIVARSRYHVRQFELLVAGAREVVDEERYVGAGVASIIAENL